MFQAEIGDLDEFDDIPDTKSWRKRAIEQMKQLDPVLPDHITASIAEMTVRLTATLLSIFILKFLRLITGTKKSSKVIKITKE